VIGSDADLGGGRICADQVCAEKKCGRSRGEPLMKS
jgi:hypothetical protein